MNLRELKKNKEIYSLHEIRCKKIKITSMKVCLSFRFRMLNVVIRLKAVKIEVKKKNLDKYLEKFKYPCHLDTFFENVTYFLLLYEHT